MSKGMGELMKINFTKKKKKEKNVEKRRNCS